MPPERLAGWLARFVERHGPITVDEASDTRLALNTPDGATAEFDVPFPPMSSASDPLDALVQHAQLDRHVGVLLVRRGGFAVGVFHGRQLLASKVGSAYVQGRTKAGGWSQQRFARRREKQAQGLWSSAAEVAVRLLLPRASDLDAIVPGGDQAGVNHVLADPRLVPIAPLVQSRLLSVPDPRQTVLAATPDRFRAVSITLNDLA